MAFLPPSPSPHQRLHWTRRPAGRQPVLFQRWRHLLFLHWTVSPETIQTTLPPGLKVDTHKGHAYLGVVPFLMRRVRPRFCPPLPGLSHFPELNLRTYVVDQEGRPGVWFYSLDAHQRLAVAIARRFFHLPYHYARMASRQAAGNTLYFRSSRPNDSTQAFTYRPVTQLLPQPKPDSLAFFLVERYLLFSWNPHRQQLHYGQVHHQPYPLHHAEAPDYSTRLFSLNDFPEPARPPDSILYSPGVDVSIFPLRKV